MAEGQIKFAFDKVTLLKIGKGMLWAIIPSALVGIANYIQVLEFGNPILAMIAVYVAQFLANTGKEWAKGQSANA